METKYFTPKQEQPRKQAGQKEASVQQLQAIRLNRYVKKTNTLLKGKEQTAPF